MQVVFRILSAVLLSSFLFLASHTDKAHTREQQDNVQGIQIYKERVFPVDWLDSGLLVLNNGDKVILSGVFVPSSRYIQTTKGKQELAQFWRLLRERVLSNLVTLYTYDTKRDRYRIRYGDIYVGNYGDWLQLWLVSNGWSWVLPSPFVRERNQALLIAEREARAKRLGFWATGDFTIASKKNLKEKNGFVMTRGRVSDVRVEPEIWRVVVDDIEIEVPVKGFVAPPLVGEIVEVRGNITWRKGRRLMSLKSHHQLLDDEGVQWVVRHRFGTTGG